MNSNNKLSQRIVHCVMLMTVILSGCSSTGNENTTDAGDSTNMSDTPMSPLANENGQSNTANDPTSAQITVDNNNPAGDTAFMMKAAEINKEEVKLGKLAQQKGTVAHVKQLGAMMVTEHTQAMTGLTALAKTKMVDLPAAESAKIAEDYKKLNAKTGKDFDKAYSDMMVNGHKEAIALFEKTNAETNDEAVKAMTAAMIPKLKKHLEHAEMCQKECEKM